MKKTKPKTFTFIDFCSGIGAGRVGLENNGFVCLGHSEINQDASDVYSRLYGDNNNYGDITKINPKKLPDFDLMLAGFPCQSFSIVGQRKGLDDERGKIIFYLMNILREKKPKYFIFENVKGLVNHNNGETINKLVKALKKEKYNVEYKVLNSFNFKVPQHRERVYFIGKRLDLKSPIIWPEKNDIDTLDKYLIDSNEKYIFKINKTFEKYLNNKYNANKFNLSELLKQDYLVLDIRQSDLRLYYGKIPTLRHGRHGILYVKNKKLRKLSPVEAFLLQGFKKEKILSLVSLFNNNKLLSLIGNAMTINVIDSLAKANFINV